MLYWGDDRRVEPECLERLRLDGRRASSTLAFAIVIFGMSLSRLHHLALGCCSWSRDPPPPLWFTPRLPLLFIVSAWCRDHGRGAGQAAARVARGVSAAGARAFQDGHVGAQAEDTLKTARAGWCSEYDLQVLARLAIDRSRRSCFVSRPQAFDLWATGAVPELFTRGFESYLYLGEYAIFTAAIAIVAARRARRSAGGLAAAAALACAGLVWNRLSVGIFGYFRDAGTIYFPSLSEWTTSLGVIAAAGLTFLYASERLSIFGDSRPEPRHPRPVLIPVSGRLRPATALAVPDGISRTTLVAVAAIPLAWAVLYPPYHNDAGEPAVAAYAPVAANAERSVLVIDANRGGATVLFPHHDHQERIGKTACATCHHLSMPRDHSTPCSRCHRSMELTTNLFEHGPHLEWVARRDGFHGLTRTNRTCSSCHLPGQPKAAAATVPCLECHRRDMLPAPGVPERLAAAASYRSAMHERCLRCHRQEAERLKRPALGNCSNCHPNGVPPEAWPGRVAGHASTAAGEAGTRM